MDKWKINLMTRAGVIIFWREELIKVYPQINIKLSFKIWESEEIMAKTL